jgi:hypothetical protein
MFPSPKITSHCALVELPAEQFRARLLRLLRGFSQRWLLINNGNLVQGRVSQIKR